MQSKSYIESEKNIYYEVVETSKHFQQLYDLLKSRKHNISHKEMPIFEDHLNFCKNNPYRIWAIIYQNNLPLGSFYLTKDNCIGLSIEDDDYKTYLEVLRYILKNIKPLPSIPSVVPSNFYCNVSPSNKSLIKATELLDGKMLQISIQF